MQARRQAHPIGAVDATESPSREALHPLNGSLPSEMTERKPTRGNAMTGKAREHEIRIMGLGLAALAVLAAFLAFWFAASLGAQLRSHASDAPVTGASGGATLVGSLEQR
jgi:hypothetical protein